MEQKQKRNEVLKDALRTYEVVQKNIYQVQRDRFRWHELKSCSQSAICKQFKISASVLSKALMSGHASNRVTEILDDLIYKVRLARLYMQKKTDFDQFLEVSNA